MNEERIEAMEIIDSELESVAGGRGNSTDMYHIGCIYGGKMEYTFNGVRCTGCKQVFADTSQFARRK